MIVSTSHRVCTIKNIDFTDFFNVFLSGATISQVFNSSNQVNDLFYTGRFDYIVYEREGKELLPIFAIELDGNEHTNDTKVIERDKKKQQICDEHNFQLIRVPNNYARRYNYAKEILSSFFENSRR